VAKLQGLPESEFEIGWLVDQQEFFQLEVFAFSRPAPRPRPAGWRPCDIGYRAIGIHVESFEETLARLEAGGSAPLGAQLGERGARRVCVLDPDGLLVEVMEDDPREPARNRRTRPGIPSVVRSVTLSVLDLDRAGRFWTETVGLVPSDRQVLHSPEHETLWVLPGAERASMLLWGNDVALELVSYAKPRARGWPEGYRISDIGIVNVAVGGPDETAYEHIGARVRAAGYHVSPEGVFRGARAVYVQDDQGFSLELLYRSAESAHTAGFEPVAEA
jgi:catechol 2,3-dioxygenase-like lactoylglutathione lyase family enzyme